MKIFKNQRGFTIVEVMVAAGMLGVVSLGVSHVMTNLGKTMKWTESKNEEMALINRFNYELRDQQVCTHTFVGRCQDNLGRIGRYTTQKACQDAQATATAPVTYTWIARPSAPALNNNAGDIPSVLGRNNTAIFTKAAIYGNGSGRITLTSMTFKADPANAPVAGTQGTAIVRLLITRNDQTGAIAAKTTATDVTMVVKWDGSAQGITECYADREDTIHTAKLQACQNIGGDYDTNEDWCKLRPGPDTGYASPPGGGAHLEQRGLGLSASASFASRAVEQTYVDDLFRRSCTGPGRVYDPGSGAGNMTGAPTCNVDHTKLIASCPVGQYPYQVSFGEGGASEVVAPGTKFDALDGDQMYIDCRSFCTGTDRIMLGMDSTTGAPNCLVCANGEIPMKINNIWTCKNPTNTGCVNTDDGTNIHIWVFDGWDSTTGNAKCREIARYPKNVCPAGQVPTSISFSFGTGTTAGNSGSNMSANCCTKGGSSCPDPSTVCANGYQAPVDGCGFACPGTKAWSQSVAQPLTYGCEYSTDVKRITRNFPEYVCGQPVTPSPTIVTQRDCYLAGDDAYHSYQQCRNAGGTVHFYSKVGDAVGPTTLLYSGKEEDSYCFFPQANAAGTYGREGTAMLASCVNCNFVNIDINAVRNARTCPGGWSWAKSFGNKIAYQVAATGCNSYGLANVGTTCGSWGESRSYTIPAGVYLQVGGADQAYWPNSYVNDGGYSPVSGTSESSHGTLPSTGTYPDAHYDAWDQDHAGCPDNANGVTHWESYLCYAKITGLACK